MKYLEEQHKQDTAKIKDLEEEFHQVEQRAIKNHLNFDEFKNDLVEVIPPTYLLGFTNAVDLATKSLLEEDAE